MRYRKLYPTSKFFRIKCNKCGNKQVVFSHPSNEIKCLACGSVLVKPTGGKGKIVGGEVVEQLE